MEIFSNSDKVLVKKDSESYEFTKEDNQLEPVEDTPSSVLEKLNENGYNVNIEEKRLEVPFRGPYTRSEAAIEMGLDEESKKNTDILNKIEYGISAEFLVKGDGTTFITKVEGNDIEPIEL